MKNFTVSQFRGFTLIELLVVVLIIGILAGVALPQYQKAVIKARATETILQLNAIEKAQIAYYLANNVYTADLEDLDITVKDPSLFNCRADSVGSFCQGHVRNQSVYFEWSWPRPSVPSSGKHWCLAYGSNKLANDICKSYGGVLDHQGTGGINYYLLQ